MPGPVPVFTLLVRQAILNFVLQSFKAFSISGRTLPASSAMIWLPLIGCPAALDSARKSSSNLARSISLRSSRAQAFSSGLVALIVRIKFSGRPCSCSKRVKASNGDVRIVRYGGRVAYTWDTD